MLLVSLGRYLHVNSTQVPWGPQGSCESCPTHAWSPSGSPSINNCKCNGGRLWKCLFAV